jgi:ABC-type proline/glycine betaine transport system permease subunit
MLSMSLVASVVGAPDLLPDVYLSLTILQVSLSPEGI